VYTRDTTAHCISNEARVRRVIHLPDTLKQRLLVEWRKLDRSIVVAAISQYRRRLSACVRAHDSHFEHINFLWCFRGSMC